LVAERPLVGNLPASLTSFVGRAEDLSHARRLLSGSRLVTLTGVGGVGKSRLALQVAQQLSRAFPDGVWLVELASLQDPVLLAQAVGHALGIADQASGNPVEALSYFLAQRRLLVVVDNCEHLVPACQLLFTALLRAAPGLRVLATSREVLRISGEQVCEVAPLAVPPPGQSLDHTQAVRFAGVALFVRRAGEMRPGFAVTADNVDAVVAVCWLSEGLPLFLELAAAQLRLLPVAQLAGRLDDRFRLLTRSSSAMSPRHQSLRAAVEWSFTLCSEAEQLMWVRASVFAGRFDLEAVEAVCAGDGLRVDDVLDVLAGLIDKSVVVSGEREAARRYWMLDTLRAYGLERLRSPDIGDRNVVDESMLRVRHRDYYQGLAERFNADWFGPRQLAWSQRMRAELPELRAALAFCLATPGEEPAAVRLAGTLNFFWYGCGATREGRLWLERALAADPSPTRDRVRALVAYIRVLISSGQHAEGVQPARECLELARRFGDAAPLADAVTSRGLNLMYTGDLAAALPLLDEGIELAAALPDAAFSLATNTLSRALAAIAAGDPARADELLARCRTVCRTHGDLWRLNHALSLSMLAALKLGDVARAAAYGRESLSGNAALGDTMGLTVILELLAWTAATGGDHQRTARLLGAADQQARANGGNAFHAGAFAAAHNQHMTATRAALGDVRFEAEFASGVQLTLDQAIAYAHGDDPTPDPQPVPTAPPPRGGLPQLTRRELEIAGLVAEGLTSKQVAHRLVIAPRTVEGHVEHILTKLGFTTRTQIATWMASRQSADHAPDGPGGGRQSREDRGLL
jgi:predicted ATPase/DNA-binding CsgD family transcriptional regulator